MADINVNNNYTDMKNLTPFKLCVLQNFPFIESDFDAVTNYQLLCKVVEYLNKVIDNNNKQNDNITQLEQNFITLYNYVKDCFDNFDVQEEINRKLDNMVLDGTIEALLAKLIKRPPYISALTIGCDNTGATDCSDLINNFTNDYIIFFPTGSYKVDKTIRLKNGIFGEKAIINMSNDTYIICDELNGSEIYGLTINTNFKGIELNNCKRVEIKNININQSMPSAKNNANFIINLIESSYININNSNLIGYKTDEYYQNDAIHINCSCNHIYVSDCHLESSDDVIAINSAEGVEGHIENVYINNCDCDCIWGIRFYGFTQKRLIKDIYINNIIIRQRVKTMPSVRVLNGGDYFNGNFNQGNCFVENININNIDCTGANRFITFAKTTGDIHVNNVKTDCKILVSAYNSADCTIDICNSILKDNSNLCEFNVTPITGYTADLHNNTINLKNISLKNYSSNLITSNLLSFKDSIFYNNVVNIKNSNLECNRIFFNNEIINNERFKIDININLYDSNLIANKTTTFIATYNDVESIFKNINCNGVLINNYNSNGSLIAYNINNTYYTDIGTTFQTIEGKINCFKNAQPTRATNGSIVIIRDSTTLKIVEKLIYNNGWTALE